MIVFNCEIENIPEKLQVIVYLVHYIHFPCVHFTYLHLLEILVECSFYPKMLAMSKPNGRFIRTALDEQKIYIGRA